MKLRDYQESGLARLAAEFKRGKRRPLMVAPTGSGKGTMAAWLLAEAPKRGQRALLLTHRREIIFDLAMRVRKLGTAAGIIMPGETEDRSAPVQLGSVQSAITRPVGRYDFVIIDEAHHWMADEWRMVLEEHKAARIVGLTATPSRGDGRPLGDVFDTLIDVVPYSALLKAGYIVPFRVLRPSEPLRSAVAQEPYEAYLKHARGRRAFMFVPTVEEAKRQAELLIKAGVSAEVISAHTHPLDRVDTLDSLRFGSLDVVVNVETMTEGIDIPAVDTVVLARACRHAGSYIQCTNRAGRAAPGKAEALLIDLCGVSYFHGLPTDDRAYSLRGRPITLGPGEDVEILKRAPYRRTMGEVLDLELEEYSEETQVARGRRRVDWAQLPLGVEADTKIAKRIGVSHCTVRDARQARGIPATPRNGSGMRRDPDIGKVPDRVIAERYGVSIASVHAVRKRRGIPAFRTVALANEQRDPSAHKRAARPRPPKGTTPPRQRNSLGVFVRRAS